MSKEAMLKLADMNEQGTTPKARRMIQAMLELALAPTAETRSCASYAPALSGHIVCSSGEGTASHHPLNVSLLDCVVAGEERNGY